MNEQGMTLAEAEAEVRETYEPPFVAEPEPDYAEYHDDPEPMWHIKDATRARFGGWLTEAEARFGAHLLTRALKEERT